MSSTNTTSKPPSGFLIVKSFEALYFEYDRPAKSDEIIYGLPRLGIAPSTYKKRYLGAGRENLSPWFSFFEGNTTPPFEIEAAKMLGQLEEQNRSNEGHVESFSDVTAVHQKLKKPNDWEIIWATYAGQDPTSTSGLTLLGYEPNYFAGDHFSPINDSMFFTKWNGTDEQGQLFLPYFEQLNTNGLFSNAETAEKFLEFYTQKVTSEKISDFEIISVWATKA